MPNSRDSRSGDSRSGDSRSAGSDAARFEPARSDSLGPAVASGPTDPSPSATPAPALSAEDPLGIGDSWRHVEPPSDAPAARPAEAPDPAEPPDGRGAEPSADRGAGPSADRPVDRATPDPLDPRTPLSDLAAPESAPVAPRHGGPTASGPDASPTSWRAPYGTWSDGGDAPLRSSRWSGSADGADAEDGWPEAEPTRSAGRHAGPGESERRRADRHTVR